MLSSLEIHAIGQALNESLFCECGVSAEYSSAILTFNTMSWDVTNDAPISLSVGVTLYGVTRIVGSLREGDEDLQWLDRDAQVVPFELAELSDVVLGMGDCRIYGWKRIDDGSALHDYWLEHNASLDYRFGDGPEAPHYFDVFKESMESGSTRYLELRIWFSTLAVQTGYGEYITLGDLAARSDRWWQAMHEGDERTKPWGIRPFDD